MNLALIAIAVAPALALGSFLNVVAARLPLGLSVVSPGSACPRCSAPIRWYDNVPLLSFLLLRGACRQCAASIPWIYPAVEVATASLIVGCLLRFGITYQAALAGFFCAALVAVSATDIERRVIPNRIVLPAAVVVLVGRTLLDPSPEWAIGALGMFAFLFLIALAYPGGMGMGDVKLGLLVGAAMGRVAPVAMMVSLLAALGPATILLARHGRGARKMGIPFGPFLALGGVVGLFAGRELLDLYLRLL